MKLCMTGDAAAQCASPAWSATTVQVPTARIEIVLPLGPPYPHTLGVEVVKVTGSPDDAVALTVKEPLPTSLSGRDPNVIVWLVCVVIGGTLTMRPAVVVSRWNVIPPMIVVNTPRTVT